MQNTETINIDKRIVIVTGAMGFVGSHLVDRLVSRNCFVIGIDNLGSGKLRNIRHLDHSQFKAIIADCCWQGLKSYLEEILGGRHVDEIYYLASPASPVHYLKYPLATIHANTIGLENFLQMAHKWTTAFYYTSTSEIYGDPEITPQHEDYNGNVDPLGDRSVYDEAKRLGETLVMTYMREYGTYVKIARLFNTYGPRMAVDDGRVIPTFINAALRNEDLPIMGNGQQTRSFCYVTDTVNGILEMADFCPMGGAYNIGNPNEYYTIAELADLVRILIPQSQSHIKIVPFISENDPKLRRPDIEKITGLTSWRPWTTIENGLLETIKYFRGLNES